MNSRTPRRFLADELAAAAAAYQAAAIIPHCVECSKPCCRLDPLVLELDWKQLRALWRIEESRAAFDRQLCSGKGPRGNPGREWALLRPWQSLPRLRRGGPLVPGLCPENKAFGLLGLPGLRGSGRRRRRPSLRSRGPRCADCLAGSRCRTGISCRSLSQQRVCLSGHLVGEEGSRHCHRQQAKAS